MTHPDLLTLVGGAFLSLLALRYLGIELVKTWRDLQAEWRRPRDDGDGR